MITEREEKCVSGLIKREERTCSSREQIYLLCPHMEVAQDVKFECTSDITVISHLDIPISVMPERPFLVSFISLPKQFKTNGKTTGKKKKSTWGCYRGSSPGLSFYLPSKVQHSWPNLSWKKPRETPACLPIHLELHLPRRNLHHLPLLSTLQVQYSPCRSPGLKKKKINCWTC